MSEEEKDKKERAAAGGFESGLKSALEKAPGLTAPGWLTMQTAMAGGAAGGAAGLTWRWIVGPVAGAALIGGALWWSQPEAEHADDLDPVQDAGAGWFVEGEERDSTSWNVAADGADAEAVSPAPREGNPADDAASRGVEGAPIEGGQHADRAVRTGTAGQADNVAEPVPNRSVPDVLDASDAEWADLPVEKAAAFGVDVKAACVGTEIGFRMARPMEDVRVLWNFGDGQFSSDAEPQHVFRAPGTYDITLSVTRVSDGLIRTRTIENLVTIHPNPTADFTWEVPAKAEDTPTVNMRDRSRDAASSTWIVDGESTQAGAQASFRLDRVGEHVVQLVASSPNGCQTVAQHPIEIGNRFGIGGSGRFSPNGDGRYDTFLPRGLTQLDRPFVFRIEDAQGRIVFETTQVKAWDGVLPDGNMARGGQVLKWSVVIQGKAGPSYFSDEVIVE